MPDEFEDFNNRVIREFRENDGRVGPPFEGATMVLVHHKGAKSGTVRTTPLVWFADGDRYLIVASKGGAPTHPAWYHNLKAHPEVDAELADGAGVVNPLRVRAEEITGAERDAAFARIVEAAPGFGDYERRTEGVRTIPVFALTPA